MGTSLVPMIIEQMSKAYPRIRFELVMADPVTLRERELRGRRVDLVIGQRITPGFDTDDLNVTVLFNDRLRIVAAKSNPWAARRKIALADLIGDRWCLPPPSHPVGALVHEAFRRRKLPPPQPVVEAQTAPFTCSLVAGGQYLGVLGLVFLGAFDRLAAIKVLPVDLPIGEWPVSILTLRNRAPNPVTRLFVDHAQEVVRSLATKRR
jgi:DNA-binding transcriptional LysR family regulator